MAASKAIVPFNVKLEHAAYPTPATYTAVKEMRKVTVPKIKTGKAKATNYDTSSTDKQHEYVPGWKDGDSIPMEANYEKSEYALLDGLQGTKLTWRLTYDDGSTHTFPGHIEELDIGIPEAGTDDVYVSKFTLFVDGKPTFTPGP